MGKKDKTMRHAMPYAAPLFVAMVIAHAVGNYIQPEVCRTGYRGAWTPQVLKAGETPESVLKSYKPEIEEFWYNQMKAYLKNDFLKNKKSGDTVWVPVDMTVK